MKLGLSVACYRWELYSDLQRTRTEYAAAGYPKLYFSTVPVALPLEEGGLEWLMDHCAELGLSCLYMYSSRLKDPSYACGIREKAERLGLELIMAVSFDWPSTGEVADREIGKFGEGLRVSQDLGVDVVVTTHSDPLRTNHFTRDPDISTQIERMTENFARVASLAESLGLVVALENHTDYRCSEILQVLEAVDSPSLRVNFDTGNTINVIEDPVDAARTIASHTVMVHLKDYRIVVKSAIDGTPMIRHAPIGLGDIDLAQILHILQQEAPDPDSLRLCIETVPPLEVDPGIWVRKSIDNTRDMFGEYLT